MTAQIRLSEIKLDDNGNKVKAIVEQDKKLNTLDIKDVIQLISDGKHVKNAMVHDNELYIVPASATFEDLTNTVYYDWTVKEYLGNSNWKCQCTCGTIKSIKKATLKNGMSKSCGHNTTKFIDLRLQKYFNDWEVLDYVPSKSPYSWKCRCSCNKIAYLTSKDLRTGQTKSCGHDKNTFIDLTGQTFGEWTVLKYAGKGKWTCRCSCNNVYDVQGEHLRDGSSKSCGHNTARLKDLTGQTIGEWTVLKHIRVNDKLKTYYICKCKCNRVRLVDSQMLRLGKSLSCGNCDRTDVQVQMTSNEELFNSCLARECINKNRQLTINEAAQLFGISTVYCKILIKRYNSQLYISDLVTNRSKAEEELAQYLETLGINIERSNRTIIAPQELDIYIPSHKLAIEYNGVYWHSAEKRDKDYHLNKTLRCKENNVQLIHVFEHEWEDEHKREIICNMLKTRLGYEQKCIYARQTEVRMVESKEAEEFISKYHLQGAVHHNVALGLYYNNELIEIMTFGTPRYNKDYDTELLRLCTKAGYIVIGGAGKLFKHYIKSHSTESIISYCDLSKFTGKVYEQIGMIFDGYTTPGYCYTSLTDLDTLSRQQCMKQKLIDKGWGTEEQTEEEIMYAHNYIKTYNCGNARYIYKGADKNG